MKRLRDLDTPGLKVRRRASGKVALYWCATQEAVERGYEPRVVRLDDPEHPRPETEIAYHCQQLWADMQSWLYGGRKKSELAKRGTFAWLIDRYTSDMESPYREVRASTRSMYDQSLAILRRTIGDKPVGIAAGPDIRRWHKAWGHADPATGIIEHPRRAYGCIQLLRILVKYGTTLKHAPSRELRDVLSEMDFSGVRRRTVHMTFEQSSAFRRAAHERGRPELALAMAFQFELGLRQKDVIGEWVRTPAGRAESGIVDGPDLWEPGPYNRPRHWSKWSWGLTWSHIDGNMILRKPTSKSNGTQIAEHDLRRYPEILAEISRVPIAQRLGPIILDPRSQLPFRTRHFVALWRDIADHAGLPETLWSTDARAGAVSEAYEAGAEPTDVMKLATHTQMSTNMRYNRGALEQTSRVADLRSERRKRDKEQGK